ncbi:alpha/beta hydrolase fold domain-containing protein [Rhizobium lusitanum]|uniref:Alpha/beta hydrolase fold domain-containing protein n=1 Tax=Rhizobium lusitanum TaxID=293958 RepID=A0A6L9UD90_9HYPH|nr:alpha/beta hydrolase [Rhizobium lusitanum]NEI72242.1 alpha/beta hydrolase fold domain-containing protein [Rhizobium lusitanum]
MSETDPFRIRAHVPEFDLISEEYRRASDAARSRWSARTDMAYGPGPSDRLDLFFPENADGRCPIHIFVHGGYWRANVKEDYAFIANTVCAAGSIAAIVEYGRLPKMRMAALVEQVRGAVRWLERNASSFGGNPEAISASGHSAGAHLAFYLTARGPSETGFQPTPVKSILLVSGIYDLRPIVSSFLQAEISLRDDETVEWSPLNSKPRPGTCITIAVGGKETRPFIEQAQALANMTSSSLQLHIRGADHMSIVRDMGDASTQMGCHFREFLETEASIRGY